MRAATLSEAVLQALETAYTILEYAWHRHPVEPTSTAESVVSFMQILHRWLAESRHHADKANLYEALYPFPVQPIAGQAGVSNHAIGFGLANSVFQGVCCAADLHMAAEVLVDDRKIFDFSRIVDGWSRVREYAIKDAPQFNLEYVVGVIQDEAHRAEEKHGKDALVDKDEVLFLGEFYKKGRGCLWLLWYETEGPTFHSPAAIVNKWNLLPDDVRGAVDAKFPDKLLTDMGLKISSNRVVKSAIERARKKRDG